MKLAKLFVSAVIVGATLFPLAASNTTQAQDMNRRPRTINERQRNERQRIHQGVRSGELTRREASRLAAEQRRIARREAAARESGGTFTARERARIRHQQSHASSHIYLQKHDRQDRHPRSINERQRHQQQRIRQGVRSDELTRGEALRLAAEQRRIARREAAARESGDKFTARERARIRHQQQHASRHIYRQKHDRQDRN